MNLMGSAIWGLGFAIVEARQKTLLKRLVASPMPRWQYPLVHPFAPGAARHRGRRLPWLCPPRLRLPFRGSLAQLAFLCVLTSLSFSALGLLIASRARTMEAASALMNPAMLPMWDLSGVFFSASLFPRRHPALRPARSRSPPPTMPSAPTCCRASALPYLAAPVAILLAWLVVFLCRRRCASSAGARPITGDDSWVSSALPQAHLFRSAAMITVLRRVLGFSALLATAAAIAQTPTSCLKSSSRNTPFPTASPSSPTKTTASRSLPSISGIMLPSGRLIERWPSGKNVYGSGIALEYFSVVPVISQIASIRTSASSRRSW